MRLDGNLSRRSAAGAGGAIVNTERLDGYKRLDPDGRCVHYRDSQSAKELVMMITPEPVASAGRFELIFAALRCRSNGSRNRRSKVRGVRGWRCRRIFRIRPVGGDVGLETVGRTGSLPDGMVGTTPTHAVPTAGFPEACARKAGDGAIAGEHADTCASPAWLEAGGPMGVEHFPCQ